MQLCYSAGIFTFLLLSFFPFSLSANLGNVIAADIGMTSVGAPWSTSSSAGTTQSSSLHLWSNTSSPSGVGNHAISQTLLTPLSVPVVTAASSTNQGYDISYTGDCWNQWTEFWDHNGYGVNVTHEWSWLTTKTSTIYTPLTTAWKIESIGDSTYYETWTDHDDAGLNGGYDAYGTSIETTVVPGDGASKTYFTTTGTSTITSTTTTHDRSWSYVLLSALPTPKCVLPSRVAQCESQWEQHITGGVASFPVCTQASIPDALCSSAVSNRFAGQPIFGNSAFNGWVTNGTSTWWPTTEWIAPGCTLGCQQCAITANTVQLYYWPPTTAAAVENGTMTARPSRLLANASAEIVTAIIDNFTMTSPTIYISYAKLYASNSCSGVGKTHLNTIIPMANSESLSSLAYSAIDDHVGYQPGNWIMNSWQYITKPYNFADLIEPIPASIYNQMPGCQLDYHIQQTAGISQSFTCTLTLPYAPIIALPSDITNVDPEWASCTVWYDGAMDPPRALSVATAVATMTFPTAEAATTTPAAPSSVNGDGLPRQTSTAAQDLTRSPSNGLSSTQAAASSPTEGQDQPAQTSQTLDALSILTAALSAASTAASDPADIDNSGTLQTSPASAAAQSTAGSQTSSAVLPSAASATFTIILGNTTISLNQGSSTVLDGQTIVAASSGAVLEVGSQRITLTSTSSVQIAASTVVTAGSDTFTAVQPADGTNAVSIIDSTATLGLEPGDTTVLDGQTIAAPAAASSGGVVVGSATVTFSTQPSLNQPSAVVTAGSQTFTIVNPTDSAAGVGILASSSTIGFGQDETTIINGQTIAVASSGGVVVGSSTVTFPTASSPDQPAAVVTAGSQTFTIVNPTKSGTDVGIVSSGSTISLGQDETTVIDGQTIAVASSGGVVVGSQTLQSTTAVDQVSSTGTLFSFTGQTDASETLPIVIASPTPESAAIIVAGQHTFSAVASQGRISVDGTTLTKGQTATISDQVFSAGDGVLVAGSSTASFVATLPSIIANSASAYTVGSQTLLPGGPAVTQSGTTYSLASSATDIVINGQTSPLAADTTVLTEVAAVLTLGSVVLTAVSAASGAIVIDGATMSIGGAAQTINGEVASDAAEGIVLGGGSTTVPLSWVTTAVTTMTSHSTTNGTAPSIAVASEPPVTSTRSAGERSVVMSWVARTLTVAAFLSNLYTHI
nr:hypothetical protein CFP56_52196 [Quercus suber]